MAAADVKRISKGFGKFMVNKLDNQGKNSSRSLWEDIFSEDTKEFLDYYYQEKTKENEVFGIYEDKQLVSMLHLNPYKLSFQGKAIDSDYIVAVATKEEYRHQGKMAELLKKVFQWAKEKKHPFVFLMPAKEDIYKPFGFETVYWRRDYCLQQAESGKEENSIAEDCITIEEISGNCSQKVEEVLKELVEYSNKFLKENYQVYAVRDMAYYQQLLKEQQSQKGSIVIGRDKKSGELCGYCFLTKEGEIELREVVTNKKMEHWWLQALMKKYGRNQGLKITGTALNLAKWKEEKIFPCIMVRITDLEAFLALLPVKPEEKMWINQQGKLQVVDEIFSENTGVYWLRVLETPDGDYLKAEKVEESAEGIFTINIEEILKKSFRNLKIFLNEVV